MRREAAHAGLSMSVRVLLTTLANIQETVLLYPGERGPLPLPADLDPHPAPPPPKFDLDRHPSAAEPRG